MAKYSKKKQKKNGRIILLIVLAVSLAALVWLISLLAQRDIPTLEQGTVPVPTGEVNPEPGTDTDAEEETQPLLNESSNGLHIHQISSYAGMYMEDGTNEPVTDVMMIILENISEQDLQLARISIAYEDFTAEFEVTNLPAGEKAVVLEKNRHPEAEGEYRSIRMENVVFFPEAMSLQENRLKITGSNGMLTVENISGKDIPGDIYVYYKHSAADLLYGGITYRVAVRGGLKAGQSSMVIAGHYTPDTCRLLMADCGD